MRSMIRSKNNQNPFISIQNIQLFIQKMTKLQFSVSQLIQEFVQKQTQNHQKLDVLTLDKRESNQGLNSNKAHKPIHLNLLKISADNFDGFDGCVLNEIDQTQDLEMKQFDESDKKIRASFIEEGTAKYYHDDYYGQNGIYLLVSYSKSTLHQ